MTEQCKILINPKTLGDVGYNYHSNPFYNKTEEFVKVNLDMAREAYPMAFDRFRGSWILRQIEALGILLDPEDPEAQIDSLVKEHKILPNPPEHLREFRV